MREAWIDRWKGLLILLVVLGHAAGGGGNLADGLVAQALAELRRVIYVFHMPAFFVLAGLCWRRRDMSISTFAAKKFVRLLVPYFVFGVASWLVYDVMYHSWGAIGGQMWQLLITQGEYKCNSVLWFLPTMFMVMFAHLMLEKIILSRIQKREIAILAVVAFFDFIIFFFLLKTHCENLPFKLYKASLYWFFFLIGRMAKIAEFRPPQLKRPLLALVAIPMLMVVAIGCNRYTVGGYMQWMFQGALGTLVTALVAKSLPVRCFAWLEWIGGMSMGIMLVHKFPLVAIQEHLPFIRRMFGADLSLAMLGILLVFVAATGVSAIATLLMRRYAPFMIGGR